MCCGGFEWSVLHPSWLRSRKNGRKRECVRACVREVGGGAAEWCVNDADAYSSVLQVAAFGRGGAEGKKRRVRQTKEDLRYLLESRPDDEGLRPMCSPFSPFSCASAAASAASTWAWSSMMAVLLSSCSAMLWTVKCDGYDGRDLGRRIGRQ